jgi:hypothetical protein
VYRVPQEWWPQGGINSAVGCRTLAVTGIFIQAAISGQTLGSESQESDAEMSRWNRLQGVGVLLSRGNRPRQPDQHALCVQKTKHISRLQAGVAAWDRRRHPGRLLFRNNLVTDIQQRLLGTFGASSNVYLPAEVAGGSCSRSVWLW